MELFSDKWNIRAGDVFLENKKTQFLNFNKKVQGIATNFDFGTEDNKTNVFASAALVRGQYAKSNFVGQEGNQGPYKLKGQNGELYVLEDNLKNLLRFLCYMCYLININKHFHYRQHTILHYFLLYSLINPPLIS